MRDSGATITSAGLWTRKNKNDIDVDVDGRSDVTAVNLARGVTGHELREIEQETGTFCFMADEKLHIFSYDAGAEYLETGRCAAQKKVNRLHNIEQDKSWRGWNSKGGQGAQGKRDSKDWRGSGHDWKKDWQDDSSSRGGRSWRSQRSRTPTRKYYKDDSWNDSRNDSQPVKKAGAPLRRLSWEARRKSLR